MVDAIHDDMGMNVFPVLVGRYQHLMPWETVFAKFLGHLVGLLRRDLLLRGEALHEMLVLLAVLFIPHNFRRPHLLGGGLRVAIDTRYKPVFSLFLLGHIVDGSSD